MGMFGLVVLARALWTGLGGHTPAAETMGIVGILASGMLQIFML